MILIALLELPRIFTDGMTRDLLAGVAKVRLIEAGVLFGLVIPSLEQIDHLWAVGWFQTFLTEAMLKTVILTVLCFINLTVQDFELLAFSHCP